MASLKEIKARISSVKSTLKITQAMKMVASAKLRKAQKMVAGLDAYKSALNEILQRLSQNTSSSSLAVPQSSAKRVAIVVFSSNTALCGSYNSNIFKALDARIAEVEAAGNPVTVFPVGEKVAKMARKAGRDVNYDFVSAGGYRLEGCFLSSAYNFISHIHQVHSCYRCPMRVASHSGGARRPGDDTYRRAMKPARRYRMVTGTAMTGNRDNDSSAQPQRIVMGAARGDTPGSEELMESVSRRPSG